MQTNTSYDEPKRHIVLSGKRNIVGIEDKTDMSEDYNKFDEITATPTTTAMTAAASTTTTVASITGVGRSMTESLQHSETSWPIIT